MAVLFFQNAPVALKKSFSYFLKNFTHQSLRWSLLVTHASFVWWWFIPPFILKDCFSRHRTCSWQFFSPLRRRTPCLMPCFAGETCTVVWIVPLYAGSSSFGRDGLQDFHFGFSFQKFNNEVSWWGFVWFNTVQAYWASLISSFKSCVILASS